MIRVRATTFNGIKFNVLAVETDGGFRQAEHTFNNNTTTLTGHGIKNKTYSLEAVHFNNSNSTAIEQANSLIDELSRSGAGILVHPDLGELSVGFDSFKTSVDTKRNTAQTSLTFKENKDISLFDLDFRGILQTTIEDLSAQTVNRAVAAVFVENPVENLISFKVINSRITPTSDPVTLKKALSDALLSNYTVNNSQNNTVREFSAQHSAISTARGSLGRVYRSKNALLVDSTNINTVFSNELLTNSPLANDFYSLKAKISNAIFAQNLDLPAIKTARTNTELPQDLVIKKYGDGVAQLNQEFHPLFSNQEQEYVAES